MSSDTTSISLERINRWVSIGIVAVAVVLGLIVLHHSIHQPRTDDATVFANYIGIAPQVEGPLVRLNVESRGNTALMQEKTAELLRLIRA